MKRPEKLEKHYQVLHNLSCLPRKMLSLYGSENVTGLVLHELCNEKCFDLDKAAYFVDNPDFNCLKGVVGINKSQDLPSGDIWKNADSFSNYMKNSEFNNKVRSLTKQSSRSSKSAEQELANAIASDLGMKHYKFCSWDMKHQNHGLLVYEKSHEEDQLDQDHLLNGLSLLSFCPIY